MKLKLIMLLCILLISCDMLTVLFTEEKPVKTKNEYYNTKINNQLIVESVFLCSRQFNISPDLIMGIIRRESNFDENAINTSNQDGSKDQGIMQLNSNTFRDLTDQELYDIECNIFNGSRLLAELLEEFDGKELLAVSAYNAGSWAVKNNCLKLKTLKYTNDVLQYKAEYEKEYLELLINTSE
jgi:soluble lytic murein transglycosylase-like protein